jgi:hypothetical protein
LKIISTVRETAGLTQKELVDLLKVRQFYVFQIKAWENITFGTLISTITAMGGSINLMANSPDKIPVQFSQIEASFLSSQTKTAQRAKNV